MKLVALLSLALVAVTFARPSKTITLQPIDAKCEVTYGHTPTVTKPAESEYNNCFL